MIGEPFLDTGLLQLSVWVVYTCQTALGSALCSKACQAAHLSGTIVALKSCKTFKQTAVDTRYEVL